jgi:hypothetical protein
LGVKLKKNKGEMRKEYSGEIKKKDCKEVKFCWKVWEIKVSKGISREGETISFSERRGYVILTINRQQCSTVKGKVDLLTPALIMIK